MPRILGVGTSVPPHTVRQDRVREFACHFFRHSPLDIERLLPVFENTTILERHFCMPPEWFETPHGFVEKNEAFLAGAVALATEAVEAVCRTTGISPDRIGHIFFISTTGIATPSIDAHLFNHFKLRPTILRTPIWGLGCAGGIAGMIRAADWLKAYPEEIALVVALELCGLTFIHNDLSKSNFIATSLFGDGCGALVMAGDRSAHRTERMLSIGATGAVTWPDTLDIMGWDIVEEGLKVLFSKSIPHIVHRSAGPALLGFLERSGLSMADIRHFLSHPGGARVIEAYRDALGLEESQVESMRYVLSHYGNMSSATVTFVLEHFLGSENYRSGDRVLCTALGPGFSSEMFTATCQG